MAERNDNEPDENTPAVLPEGEPIHTTTIGIIGGTAQIDLALPSVHDEDDFDDDVVDDAYLDDNITTGDIPVGALTRPPAAADADADAAERTDAVAGAHEHVHEADIVDDDAPEDTGAEREDTDVVDAEELTEPAVEQHAVEPAHAEVGGYAHPESAPSADAASEQARSEHADVTASPAASAAAANVVATLPAATGAVPTTRRSAHHPGGDDRHTAERVGVSRPAEVLQSRRIGDLEPGRESSDLLTAERLLDPAQIVRAEPEGPWQRFVYNATGHRVNLGDGKRARARKLLDTRISAPLSGGAKFVPVLSRKGGVGKTTVTTLLGMALADARDDRVIAIDANPDRGTLADRVGRSSGKTVRDLVRVRKDVVGFNDLSSIVARDETRLDVLASDADPHVSEAFSDRDYHDVASIAAHYYSIVLTDTGTGIVHSVMGATLELSDQVVIVAGLSVDEARLASETLTWLESNGYAEQVKSAVVVLNTARPGTPLVRADELERHFRTRVRTVIRIPYDPHLAAGSAVAFRDLTPATREAARQLAASVVEGLRLLSPAA